MQELAATIQPEGQVELPSRYLLLDLEVSLEGKIHDIGATRGGETFRRKGVSSKSLEDLARFSEGACAVIGHNLIRHDLGHLRAVQPDNPVLGLPGIDTLLLSPLCFPENPYHHLIKDYKLVKDSLNDPVADARLAGRLFKDEVARLEELNKAAPELTSFYRACLASEEVTPRGREGFELLFEEMGISMPQPDATGEIFRKAVVGRACIEALDTFIEEQFPPGLPHAYILAWLRVAGSNSVLPHWVRHSHGEIPGLVKRLRDQRCTSPGCEYCQTTHNARKQLQKYSPYDNFRPKPEADDGSSLQETIVTEGMLGNPLLAILPTGGGKSLGFQIPALVRHYRRGVLTIVLSPLQALMKDQVDNLRELTEMYSAIDAIYGLQTLPERGAVYEKLILGDIAILYVSPEQLRNKRFRDAIAQREIGCWVFDEAHCLSKWGHDFRPDYTYAGRFIRELSVKQGEPSPPPVACFTATAKLDVREELLEFFRNELNQELKVFDGGTERENLVFDVQVVKEHQKPNVIIELLAEHIEDPQAGAAVIFCATRKKVETLAGILRQKGLPAEGFHAGLDNEKKTQILDDFNRGDTQVICATNAFGMGVDKPDIRVVIHHDIPSSLENYIQEAGRAGRDQLQARCVLLYNPGDGENGKGDIDTQFTLDSFGRISRYDIRDILRRIRYRQKKEKTGDQEKTPHVYLSAEEILSEIETSFSEEQDSSKKTKVGAAIANLEYAGFLERNENRNQVFNITPLVPTMEEAAKVIKGQKLSELKQTAWTDIYRTFLNLDPGEQPRLDALSRLPSLGPLVGKNEREGSVTRVVFRTLGSMVEAGLIKKDISYSAVLRYKVSNSSEQTFSKFFQLEKALLDMFRGENPDAQAGETQDLNIKKVVTKLRQEGFDWCLPAHIHRLLGILRLDGTGFSGNKGSLIPRELGQGLYKVKLQQDLEHIVDLSGKRLRMVEMILKCIDQKILDGTSPSATLQVHFDESDLLAAFDGDLFLKSEIDDPHAAIQTGLRYLHESRILQVRGGAALISQQMRLDLNKDSFGRGYTAAEHKHLQSHYMEKNLQIHVMAEYARLGDKELTMVRFVLDYFNLGKAEFIKRYFAGRAELLHIATSLESYGRIIENLKNPYQQSIVSSRSDENLLVLAGPGSGKTHTIAHRCAYLLCVERIKPRQLLVLCYNRSAAISLRQRVRNLAGQDSWGITISTFHSLAMRLLGISAVDAFPRGMENDTNAKKQFEGIIPEATALLDGSKEIPGMDNEQLLHSLIGSWSHILIDEYQDIDQEQYDFVSAISGRIRQNPDTKLSILAVGDDDQNIYQFRHTSTEFIRQFESDYEAKSRQLVENYRSTINIISAANHLIAQNRDRMKTEHPIRINDARKNSHPGGASQETDPVGKGFVQVLKANNVPAQGASVLAEIQRLRDLSPGGAPWRDFAILARGRPQLHPMRALLEANGIPVEWACGLSEGFPLSRVREVQEGLDVLNNCISTKEGLKEANASELAKLLPSPAGNEISPWQQLFQKLLQDWCCEIGDAPAPIESCIHFLHDALVQMKYEHRHGNGIFLGTAHSAKGLEFKHVIILDGSWMPKRPQELEEQRRLYYVAMTRAMENLILMQCNECNNPFTGTIVEANGTLSRESPSVNAPDAGVLSRIYHFLGMKDLYLDLGSRNSRVRDNVSSLQPEEPLTLGESGDRVLLLNKAGQQVGTLSRSASNTWKPRLGNIKSAKVFAIVRRHKDDCAPEYQRNCIAETWEVPLAEVVT